VGGDFTAAEGRDAVIKGKRREGKRKGEGSLGALQAK